MKRFKIKTAVMLTLESVTFNLSKGNEFMIDEASHRGRKLRINVDGFSGWVTRSWLTEYSEEVS